MPVGQVLAWSHLIGLALALAWVALDDAGFGAVDVIGGGTAGVFGLAGLVFLYLGLARGRVAVVAPSAAVVGAAIPVGYGILGGESASGIAWIGVGIGVVAIWLVSTVEGLRRRAGGLGHGAVAGVFFGGYFIALASVGESSGLWPLVASRAVSGGLLFGLALLARNGWSGIPPKALVGPILGVGVFDLVGNIGYLVASRLAPIVIVAVVASLYPAVTVMLARIVDREPLTAGQVVGLALGVGAVALLSIG